MQKNSTNCQHHPGYWVVLGWVYKPPLGWLVLLQRASQLQAYSNLIYPWIYEHCTSPGCRRYGSESACINNQEQPVCFRQLKMFHIKESGSLMSFGCFTYSTCFMLFYVVSGCLGKHMAFQVFYPPSHSSVSAIFPSRNLEQFALGAIHLRRRLPSSKAR